MKYINIKFHISFIIFCLVVFCNRAHAQINKYDIKAQYVYNIATGITWPDENKMEDFKISVIDNENLHKALVAYCKTHTVKGHNVVVNHLNSFKEIAEPQIILLNEESNSALSKVQEQTKGKPILIITENFPDANEIMVNFTSSKLSKRYFNLNANNLSKANLTPGEKLILHGGTLNDLQIVFNKKIKILEQKQAEIEVQKKSIVQQKIEIVKQTERIKMQEVEIKLKQEESQRKQEEINLQAEEIKKQKTDLNKLTNAVQKKQDALSAKIKQLEKFEKDVEEQTAKLQEGRKMLEMLNKEISHQKNEIENQKINLNQKDSQIEEKDALLSYSYAMIFLTIIVLVLIFIAFYVKRKSNRKLSLLNNELAEQKEELQSKNEEVTKAYHIVELKNENIKASISYAKTIQNAILPTQTAMNNIFQGFTVYRPKDIVSGDFYWTTTTDKHTSFVAAVDCTGHGVPGAFMSMIGSRLLSNIVNEKHIHSPEEILMRMHEGIKKALKQDVSDNDDGMDICLCKIVQKDTIHITFAGAKRPLFYCTANSEETQRIKGSLNSIGGQYLNEFPFKNEELTVKKGDCIYLTSDGFTDQNNKNGKSFGTSNFQDLVKKLSTRSIDEQKQKMNEVLDKHMSGVIQRDDITIIGIKF